MRRFAGFTVVIAVCGLMLTGLSYMYGVAIATEDPQDRR